MTAVYVHTNLVAHDWRRLRDFYVEALGLEPVGAERDLAGDWLDAATGLTGARLRGQHLRMPGHGPDGPTLELFEYDAVVDAPAPPANRAGYGHIAFRVDDVEAAHARLLAAGGTRLGDVRSADIPGLGPITLVYARDPEGNVIELQALG